MCGRFEVVWFVSHGEVIRPESRGHAWRVDRFLEPLTLAIRENERSLWLLTTCRIRITLCFIRKGPISPACPLRQKSPPRDRETKGVEHRALLLHFEQGDRDSAVPNCLAQASLSPFLLRQHGDHECE